MKKEQSKPDKATKTKKEEKHMTKPIIATVFITLITVGAFALTFVKGMEYERSNTDRIKSEVKSLTAVVKESK